MDQVKQAQKRVVQYWYSDGLTELGFGALLILLGGYFFLEGSLAADHPLRFILESGFVLVIVGGSLGINKLVQWAKEHLTYQRTGFVDYPRRKSPAWAQALLGSAIAVLMAGLVGMLTISNFDADRWLPAISGLVMGGGLFYFGLRTGLIRFLVLSVMTLVIGGGVVLGGIVGSLGYGMFYALTGLGVGVSGACILVKYLRDHPQVVEQNNES